MIELPHDIGPAAFSMGLVDFGGVQRPSLGGRLTRVNRLGSRFMASVTLPPLELGRGRLFVSRLIRAKSEGLRMEIPLTLGEQGIPGVAAVVDGAVEAGTTLPVRGLVPGYVGLEGYWLSIVRGGQHYVHSVAASFGADSAGDAVVTITPPLRVALVDGDAVHLARPMIEGLVQGDELGWEISLAHHTYISFAIEEAA